MVGIVVVSHSLALAEAAVSLALDMVSGEPPRIALAAGTADGGFGTDAVRVAQAIGEADDGMGVVVLTDLGSAVLSAEMSLEFLDEPHPEVRIVPAPFVEGLLAAVVRAAGGAALDAVADEAAGALAGKIEQLGEDSEGQTGLGGRARTDGGAAPEADAAGEERRELRIVNPHGLHARPAARLAEAAASFDAEVVIETEHGRSAPAVSALGLAGLGTRGGDRVWIRGTGKDAADAVEAIAALIASGFGEAEEAVDADAADAVGAVVAREPQELPGGVRASASAPERGATPRSGSIGVSPGRVVGSVLRMPAPLPEPDAAARVAEADRPAAVAKLEQAIDEVATGLRARAKAQGAPAPGDTRAPGAAASEVLAATAALAEDPVLLAGASAAVRERGLTPAAAVWEALEEVAAQFIAAGGIQAERASDVRDIRNRVVAALTGAEPPGVPESDTPFVLVADDLAPADTAGLDPERCLGILASEGGPTSHTAILARALGIPAVVAAPVARELVAGDLVLIDGSTGEVIRDPDEAEAAGAASAAAPVASAAPFLGPGRTSDGTPIGVLANVGTPSDVALAVERGASGVGLFRTEFCFLGRREAPSLDEQIAAYREVLEGFRGEHVVIRTLDAGSDKPLPFLSPESEENPALGVRGYRTALLHPEVLTTQLRAIAAAARAVPETETWVMAPMIATVDEAEEFASAARSAGIAHVGVMVETPAAALMAQELFAHVDFVSLGTNDLAQYTMAADRLSGALAPLGDPWQPAVLRLIERCVAGSDGKPVGVCGEAASDPLLARVLVGIGVTSLSMTARAVPAVGNALGGTTTEQCETAAAAALSASTAAAAREAAARVLES